MKTILLQNGHQMYEKSFEEKVNFVVSNLEKQGCEIDGINLTPDSSHNADFIIIVNNYDDMKLRNSPAGDYVHYSVLNNLQTTSTAIKFNLK